MTEPIKEILPRETYPEIEKVLLKFSNSVDEFVNFGTHILLWIVKDKNGSDEQMPLTMFFRDLIEKADSISTLIQNSNIEPAKVVLRSLFEVTLYIKYLLEENFHDRSMSFLVWNTMRKIRVYKSYDKDDESYKTTQKILEKDEFFADQSILDEISSVKPALENFNKILNLPDYKSFVKEYKRIRKKDGRNPSWYRMFDGPKNIYELALKTKVPFLYEILYRKWSESVHGSDIIDGKILKSNDSIKIKGKVNADIVQIRLPKDAQEVAKYTLILLLMTYIKLRDKKIPSKNAEITNWYLSVREEYQEISGGKRFINVNF